MDEFQHDSDGQVNSFNNEGEAVPLGLGKTIGNLTGFMSSFTHGRASQAHEAPSSATKSTGGARDKTFVELGNEKALNEAAEETEAMAEQALIQTSLPDADLDDDEVPATIGDGDASSDKNADVAEGLVGAIAGEALNADADAADHASSGDDADIPSSTRSGRHVSSKAAATTTPKGRRGRQPTKPVSARKLQDAERKAAADAKARHEKRVKKAEATANGPATPATGGKPRERRTKNISEEQLSQVTKAKEAAVKAIKSPSKAAGVTSANAPVKRRGRPPKDPSALKTTAAKTARRGRPPKSKAADSNPPAGAAGEAPAPIVGKKRGRPPKGTESAAKKQRTDPTAPKRRGRPPKSATATADVAPRPRGRPPLHKKRGRPALTKRVFAPAVPPEPTKPVKRNTANSTGKVLRTRG